jgi:hypothetical protein
MSGVSTLSGRPRSLSAFGVVFEMSARQMFGSFVVTISTRGRKVLGVMQRDAARFKETGGWGLKASKVTHGTASSRILRGVFSCFQRGANDSG